MRRGIFLLEILFVLAVMVLLGIIMIKPMRSVTRNIPHQLRDYRANSVIYNMLEDLRKDIETSNGLLQYRGNEHAASDILLINSDSGVISYSFNNGNVTRLCESPADLDTSDLSKSWEISGGVFDWRIRNHNSKPVALEITTGIKRRTPSGVKTNLKNSHVIFVSVR